MSPDVQLHPLNNLSLKILALVFGYTLWTSLAEKHEVELSLDAPLSFYNEKNYAIQGPESVNITLRGPRKDFYQTIQTVAVHVNADTLKPGTHTITINEQNLFLPKHVKLVDSTPTIVKIFAEKLS